MYSDKVGNRKRGTSFRQSEMQYELDREIPRSQAYLLTFGKYKGKRLNEVPVTYLNWVLLNFNEEKNKSLFIKIKRLLGIKL